MKNKYVNIRVLLCIIFICIFIIEVPYGQENNGDFFIPSIEEDVEQYIGKNIEEDIEQNIENNIEKNTEKNIGQKNVDKLRSQKIAIGRIKPSDTEFKLGHISIPAYECKDEVYVAISDLRQVGANVTWDSISKTTVIYNLGDMKNTNVQFEILKKDYIAYLGRGLTYINYQEIPSIFVQGKTLIPVKWLSVFLDYDNHPFQFVKIDSQWEMENYQDELYISGINIWFDGENYIEEPYILPELKFGEHGYYRDYKYDSYPNYIYVGFLIQEINGIINENFEEHKTWLKNPSYYTLISEQDIQISKELFPTTVIKGNIRYAVSGFTKGEEVEIERADSGVAYYVYNKDSKIVKIPWNSVEVKKVPISKHQATKEEIEQYINKKNIESKTKYLVWTDLHRQRTYVLQGSKNNWELLKSIPSSTGRDITPTPKGQFTLNKRVPYFGKGYMAKNAVAFIGTEYLYHSVLYDATGKYLLEGRGVLGQKASQGCIRFSPEDSLWFYNTMPLGTKVYIN